jgi:hypothetical protein
MASNTSINEDSFGRGEAHSRTFEWRTETSAAMAVVESVAAVTNQDPTEMVPLNDVVNTDALNNLFTPTDDNSRARGYVQFEYERCQVRVRADGTVLVVRD